MAKILVPGGAGFIGSHTVAALIGAGFEPLVLDNLSNGHRDSVCGVDVATDSAVRFIEGDIRDSDLLDRIFADHQIDAVIHFAAFIEAGESVQNPLSFYENNTAGSLSLLAAMQRASIKRIVFSSTAAVYGQPDGLAPLLETLPKTPINPYGESKWAVECMLRDCAAAHGLQATALRYFNAAGSDPAGRFGERHDPESHLIPLVLQAASGKRPNIKIFGTDYDTPDGTCIRDYVHVSDLADAHVKALKFLQALPGDEKPGTADGGAYKNAGFYDAYNLGTGRGFSVREVIETAKAVTGIGFDVSEEARRPGDPPRLVANADKAKTTFNWQPRFPLLEDMVAHAWAYLKDP